MSLQKIIVSARRVTLFHQPLNTQPQAVLEQRECLGVEVVGGPRFFNTTSWSFLCLRKAKPVLLAGGCAFPGWKPGLSARPPAKVPPRHSQQWE